MNDKPLIAHVLYRLDTGGMEHMLLAVINGTRHRYRHAVICLDGFSALRDQIAAPDVPCVALHKKPGKDWGCYARLWKALRQVKPDLVHTYNLGASDAAPIAKLAGVRRVVHAERGRSAEDPNGESRKYCNMRRWLRPFVDRYVAVSEDLETWLTQQVHIDPSRVVHIANGIDFARFPLPDAGARARPVLGEFAPPGTVLVGTVGRLDPVKDQLGLLSAFSQLCQVLPEHRARLRLAIAGEGSQRAALEARIVELGLKAQVRLLGNRGDVPELLAEFDVFVLSSIAEGMPGAVLEAMAAGLPVVATDVGGVDEVVAAGETGELVPASNPEALAEAMARYASDPALRDRHGSAGRKRVEAQFGVNRMLSAYVALYDELLGCQECAADAPRLST